MSTTTVVRTLPTTPEGVSTNWLGMMLKKKLNGFEITSTLLNQSAGKVFVTASYEHGNDDDNSGSEQPRYLCLKGSFNPAMMALPGYGDILFVMYTREVDFYKLCAPKLPGVMLPKVWATAASTVPPQGILVMEDLRQSGHTFGHPTEPWGLDRVMAGVEQLAKIHASTWNMTLEELPGFTPGYEAVMLGLTTQWDGVVLGADRPPVPAILQDRTRTVAALEKHFATKNPKFLCLVHGDPHIGNTFIDKDGRPGFLDWQTAHIGSAFHDLAYFVIGAMTIADRRAGEMAVLEHYLRTLASCGGGPTLTIEDDEVVREYRKSMMSGLGWILTPYAMHRKESVVAMVERYCAAFLDHQVIEFVESLPEPQISTSVGL